MVKRKSIESLLRDSELEGEGALKRTLGAPALVALGIGAIIGAGLFSITGMAAANHAGAAVTISFVVAAIGCAFAGLCYAEFASMIPVAGSAYTYSYATMGQMMAWIIGWDLVLEYAVGAATVAISWAGYLTKFLGYFGMEFPIQLAMSPFTSVYQKDGHYFTFNQLPVDAAGNHLTAGFDEITGFINLPAVFIVVAMSLLLIRGTKESAFINGIIVALKVTVVLIFIALGWGYINSSNYSPYIPENTGEFGHYGWSGVFRAAAIVFFAYIGFDAVSTAAQEAKNPKRDMPIGILVSLVICTILYILFAHVMTGVANYKDFAGKDGIAPVAVAIDQMGTAGANGEIVPAYPWLNKGIVLAILAGYSSVIMVMLMGQSRVFYSMSKDGFLPKVFSEIHPKYKTPAKSNLLFMVFVSLFAAFVPGHIVGEMTSIGTLLAFVLVCMGIIILRKTRPDLPRAFKTPLVPLVPVLGILTCLAMMASLPWDTWLRLVIWMAIGFAIYFGYGKKRVDARQD